MLLETAYKVPPAEWAVYKTALAKKATIWGAGWKDAYENGTALEAQGALDRAETAALNALAVYEEKAAYEKETALEAAAYKVQPAEWAAYKAAYEKYGYKKAAHELAMARYRKYESKMPELEAAVRRYEENASQRWLEATREQEAAKSAEMRAKAAYEEYEIKKTELKAAMRAAAPDEWALVPDELSAYEEYEVKKAELKAATNSDAQKVGTEAMNALAAAAPAMTKVYFALQAAYQEAQARLA